MDKYFSDEYNIPLNGDSLYSYSELNNLLCIRNTLMHMTYRVIMKYKEHFKIDTKNLDIISIVRNPYERIISDLFFLGKIDKSCLKEQVFIIIRDYYLHLDNLDNHNLEQCLFVTDENKFLINGIKIIRTESLNDDMYGLGYHNFIMKENKNHNGKINYYDYLNDDSIRLINNYYHDDFILFGYEKINIKLK